MEILIICTRWYDCFSRKYKRTKTLLKQIILNKLANYEIYKDSIFYILAITSWKM